MERGQLIRIDFQKIKGYIKSLDNYPCLQINCSANFLYMGEKWNSVEEAYNVLSINRQEKDRPDLLFELLKARFKFDEAAQAVLKKTKDMWIEPVVDNCDNFLYSCQCRNCFMTPGNNYYGRALMEARDYYLWEDKPKKINKKRWHKKYL